MKNFKILFNEIMNSLFSDKEKEKTIEEYKNSNYNGIPDECGIYTVKNSQNFEIEILEEPEIKLCNKSDFEQNFLNKCQNVSNVYLYIGKTDAKKGIKNRLKKYIKYGYGKKVSHKGGYHLWFVKNNKKLYINYATITEVQEKQCELYKYAVTLQQQYEKNVAEIIEMSLICLHDLAYQYAPLANSQNQSEYHSYKVNGNSIGCEIYKKWNIYWKNILNKQNYNL